MDFIPRTDAGKLSWGANFSSKATLSPVTYGLVAADAVVIAAAYAAFSAAMGVISNPATKTKMTVLDKDIKRNLFVATARVYARKVQGTPTVTGPQKEDLGLPVRDSEPSPVPAPASKPGLIMLNNGIRQQTVRMIDEANPTRRGKPPFVAGAIVRTYVATGSEAPPADLEKWRTEGLSSKRDFVISYNGEDVGKTAYIIAQYYNDKGQLGPQSDPLVKLVAA